MTAEVIRRVDEMLAIAKLGLTDVLERKPERRLGGLRNLIVFGRAVTNVLQNLRPIWPEFDSWYQPYVAEMRADPLLRYFYKLRSEILKEGRLTTSSSLKIASFASQDMHRLGPPPTGARGFFIGDQAGGSGWEVELPDGTLEKLYIDLPGVISSSEIHLPDAPREHRGEIIRDTRIETLATLYYEYLSMMVADARQALASAGA
jgi:hypothetical protein